MSAKLDNRLQYYWGIHPSLNGLFSLYKHNLPSILFGFYRRLVCCHTADYKFDYKRLLTLFLFLQGGRGIAAFHSGKAMPHYEVFSILLLAPDQWKLRQQLEGFLQFGGSLACWEVTATLSVTAPPTGHTQEKITEQLAGNSLWLDTWPISSQKVFHPIFLFSAMLQKTQRIL